MSDVLLPYYNRELGALRQLAAGFAEAHPKIAGRLRLSGEAVDDPHVARLLEGVAFLAARVHHRLDDEFPELTDALLGVLYPHYLAPAPSCAIVQLQGQPEQEAAITLPAGLVVETERVRGEPCRYRTAWPVTMWPIEVDEVRLSGLPLAAPPNPCAAGAVAVLRIRLRTRGGFTGLGLDRLRFFLRAPANVSAPLLELLGAHVLSVGFADGPGDARPVIVPASAVSQAGFAPEEAVLPWPARSFSGFRLLTEYFAFPDKFLFLDIAEIERKTLLGAGGQLDVFIWLDRAAPELERTLGRESLALGCTPIVNLFPQRCEPIALTPAEAEYRVVSDARRGAAMEVWQVERVQESRADGSVRPWRPFFRLTHGDPPGASVPSWQAVRRPAPAAHGGSEVFLAVSDPAFDPDRPADGVLSVDALCLNRDLPADLPFGGGHPTLRFVDGNAAVARLACLTAPTPTLRPPPREARFWRLISQLALGHLSMVGEGGATAIREVLRLYDLRDSADTRAAVDALLAVTARPGVARVPQARPGAFCRGLDVSLEFDARAWQGGGLYGLAAVLERFLALHATVNAFVRCQAVLRGQDGVAARWPARAGARVLL